MPRGSLQHVRDHVYPQPVRRLDVEVGVALGPLLRALCDTAARVSPLSLSDT